MNLPKADKWLEPKYQDLRGGQAALLTTHDGGALIRVIAGELAGHAGPGSTYTPMAMMHATVAPGARLRLPWRRDFNALVYVLSGRRHRRCRAAGRSAPGSSPCSGPATRSPSPRPRRRSRASPAWTW